MKRKILNGAAALVCTFAVIASVILPIKPITKAADPVTEPYVLNIDPATVSYNAGGNFIQTSNFEVNDISNLGNPNDKSSPAFKIAMYDRISSGLGDLMISANRDADTILQKAKDEAAHIIEQADNECSQKVKECDAAVSKIKSETEEEAAYIRERLSEAANELLKAVSADLHTNIDNCMREIETGISGMQYEVNTLMQKIEGRNSEMSDRIDYYRNCVTDGITKKLSDMDEKYGIEHDKN